MKKLLGLTFGSLQKKMIRLVLIILAASAAVFAAVTAYQSSLLAGIVSETRTEQQEAISRTSEETMYQMVRASLVKTTALQAEIADNEFSEIIDNIYMLKTMAEGILGTENGLKPGQAALPDASKDGTASAMVLAEEGVDYRKSEYIGMAAHLAAPMTAMVANSAKISACYIGFCDGTHFVVDIHSKNKFDSEGNVIAFPVRERPWYTGAAESGELYFTGIIKDAFSGEMGITCSIPVIVNGKTVGVAGIDIFLDTMDDFVEDSYSKEGFAFVVNDKGQVILAPEQNAIFKEEDIDHAEDLRQSENKDLAAFVTKALQEQTDLSVVKINDKEYFMAGAPMPAAGWTVISIVDKEATEVPENQMLAEYDQINERASEKFREGSSRTNWNTLILIAVILAAGSLIGLRAAANIVKPIVEMTGSIQNSAKTGELFEMKDSYRTNDEIEVLAESFDDLSKKTKQYIEDITRITREKERVSTELQMANQIQASMMPHIFPAYPSRHEFDIYAVMNPAKEVGGDFYDFFLIDDDHLCMVMADVSGKGIPAALFMMVSKIILQSCAMLGKSAAEILMKTNEAICSNNQQEMFVTVWLGILEISTGKITAANAGHEYPAIMKNGTFELMKNKHGLVIGGIDGVVYKEYEIDMKPGDKLFLYTDGVPEAMDASNNMFGTERMLKALNEDAGAAPEQILKNVRTAVDGFVSGAEQFDDLTMLCMEYRGTKNKA